MDQITALMRHQLTEREIIIWLLVDSGMSYREVGTRLLVDHTQVMRTYKKAQAKMDKYAKAGFYQTEVK